MDENQAHRYLQKMCMDRSMRAPDAARRIIEQYTRHRIPLFAP